MNQTSPPLPEDSLRIGFIGAGRMATALGRGFVHAGLVTAENLQAADPVEAAAAEFARQTGGRVSEDNLAVASGSDVLFLAVKPQHLSPVLGQLAPTIGAEHLVVSIVAGATLATLEQELHVAGRQSQPRLVRVMPNTPCLIGQGASGFALGAGATAEDAQLLQQLLSAVGIAHRVDEKLLDAVTGLSGSGPAFVYLMIEALSDGGVNMGLPRALATSLAAQTVAGAAQMVLQTGQHPGELKDAVASPGGTTIRGLQALEDCSARAAFIAAVEAATRRAQELGRG